MKFDKWHLAVDYLLEHGGTVMCHGREFSRLDALSAIGYEGAKRRGLLAEYKRDILHDKAA